MGQTDKQSTPKYMCLKANTQYELGQSIDAALQQAELMVQKDHKQACLHIWLEQLLDALHEEFAIEQNIGAIQSLEELQPAVVKLLGPCATFFRATQGEQAHEQAFQMTMTLVLERSFLNALDMMQARGVWRFDIQRAMQDRQGRMLDAIREFTF